MTTSPVPVWPTVDEIGAVPVVFSDAIEELKMALERLVDVDVAPAIIEGAEPLTLETVGALSGCLAKLRFDLEHQLGDVRAVERIRDVMALEQ